jgi:inorganic pyrophosphatase
MEAKQFYHSTIAKYAKAKLTAFELSCEQFQGVSEYLVPVIIEVPKNCPNKYEINKETGFLELDRVLHSSVYYPGDYGYIPNTLCEDGDPIDVVVLSSFPLQPSVLVYCRVIGLMEMTDEKGGDNKIIAVIDKDPRNRTVHDLLTDLPVHARNVITNFFSIYKNLEAKWSSIRNTYGRVEAQAEVLRSIQMYQASKKPSVGVHLNMPDYWHASIHPSSRARHISGFADVEYPEKVSAFIEVPRGFNNKYEFNHATGMVTLDRVLHSATFYPLDYGFIPQTLCEDGDPLDICVLASYPLIVGCMADVRILGILDMEDEKGGDCKVLGVISNDPRFLEVSDLDQVAPHILQEIKHFFETYKTLETGKWVRVQGWRNKAAAVAEVLRTNQIYLETSAKPLENVPRWDRLDIGSDFPTMVNAFVTCPQGSSNIYHFDNTTGLLRLNRRLHNSMYFPINSGFVPQTLAEDREEMNILIYSIFPLEPGVMVKCRVIGKLEMEDEKGPDTHIIGVPVGEPRTAEVNDIDDLPRHVKDEIFNFFQNYKMLEEVDVWTKMRGWCDKENALSHLRRAHERYFLYGLRVEELEATIVEERAEKQALATRLSALEAQFAGLIERLAIEQPK